MKNKLNKSVAMNLYLFYLCKKPSYLTGVKTRTEEIKPLNSRYHAEKQILHSFMNFEEEILRNCETLPLDIEAKKVAEILEINRNTVNRYFIKIREKIADHTEKYTAESGVFEVDESYFGARRVRGKRGRGASGKMIVFGLLKREGKVCTQIANNVSRNELMPIIKGRVLEGSTVNSDGFRTCDSLILNGYEHHRVYHSKDEFARGKSHINGIENFWRVAKVRLAKFRGIHKSHFYLHLKECEFRFNYCKKNIYTILLKMLCKDPLC